MNKTYSKHRGVEDALEQARSRKEGIEVEENKWKDFRWAHQQELKNWLIPIVENQYKSQMCPRLKCTLYSGYPSFGLVKALDKGICDYCTSQCQFKEHVLKEGEHSKEWYEIGLDKLNFKYLE